MYFKSLKMVNFRKFRTTENIIEFADAESYEKQKCGNQVDVNVASTVTLVVGKNNAGKTTIIQALDKLVNHNDKFGVKDFNMDYLKEMAMKYQEDNFEEIPSIDFEITIGLDKGKDDYVSVHIPYGYQKRYAVLWLPHSHVSSADKYWKDCCTDWIADWQFVHRHAYYEAFPRY